jgi:hypothetical protein
LEATTNQSAESAEPSPANPTDLIPLSLASELTREPRSTWQGRVTRHKVPSYGAAPDGALLYSWSDLLASVRRRGRPAARGPNIGRPKAT